MILRSLTLASLHPRLFFFSVSFLFCSIIVSAQISVPNYTPPISPKVEELKKPAATPLSISQPELVPGNLRLIELPALLQSEMQQNSRQKALRIGVRRTMPQIIRGLSNFSRVQTSQGSIYLLRILSTQAKAIRLHFKTLNLPEGARMFVYSKKAPQTFASSFIAEKNDFWTNSMDGEEIILECFIPASTKISAAQSLFEIDAINHIFRSARTVNPANPGAQLEAGACEQEVPVEFAEAARSTALISFSKTDGEYACSGTLLADVKKTGTPYFLTANHCISNNNEAESAETYWSFDKGTAPTTPPTYRASLLVTDEGDDFSLLELRDKPPGGITYSGWTTSVQPAGTGITGIHHPQAEYKRASFGKIVDASCPEGVDPEFCDFYTKVRWDRGITEPGSSGSGIFVGTGNQTQLIGLLSGGDSSCENQSGIDIYGRMTRIFGALGYYLTNGALCRYTLLQDKFVYGETANTGDFTIVPKIGGENCPWRASSNVSWVTITSPTTGNGLSKLTFEVAANTTDKPRIGAISIAGRNVIISQTAAIAPSSPCAAQKISFGQTVTGDLRTAACSSALNLDWPALRYKLDAEAGQTVSITFGQTPQNSQFNLIYPDGKVVPFRGSYPTMLPIAGTYTIELALLPSAVSFPVPFNFAVTKICKYKFSSTYFEVDGFGQLLNPGADSIPKIRNELSGESCTGIFAVADELIIDEYKLYAPYYDHEKAMFVFVNQAEDPKLRYIVIRILDQPVIIRQTPICSGSTTFSYTPADVTLSPIGGQFQMQIKRTAGPSCSWEIKPYDVVDGSSYESRDVVLQPDTYGNRARGTDNGIVTYKVPTNTSIKNNRYALKSGTEVAQAITQNFMGGTCARTTLQTGQSVNGQLNSTDCTAYESGQYVDVYQLNLAVGEQYAIELTGTAGTEITAELGISEYGGANAIADFRQKASFRYPETDFVAAYAPGTYILRVYGKPGSYQLKLLGLGPAGCVYKIDKDQNYLLPATTNSYSVKVDCTRGDCDWTAQSTAPWVTFPNGATGKGSQTFAIALAPNTGAKREAAIRIAGSTFFITQDYPCTYRKYYTAAPNKYFAGYLGGEYLYYVETGQTCAAPTFSASAGWFTATYPSPGSLILNFTANSGGFRKGTLNIGGDVFDVYQGGNDLTVTTAGDYQRTLAPGALASVFNQWMTPKTEAAQTLPLPTLLADVTIALDLSNGTSIITPLLFASPFQVNFQIPDNIPTGRTKIRLYSSASGYGNSAGGTYAIGVFDVVKIAPNIFSASSTGTGAAAANIQRVRPGQPEIFENTAEVKIDSQGQASFIARPISLGNDSEFTFLVLYATGLRKRDQNLPVTASIGGVEVPVQYAGPQGFFVGVEQINILLPKSLRGKGLVDVKVTIEGKTTNTVQINIAP